MTLTSVTGKDNSTLIHKAQGTRRLISLTTAPTTETPPTGGSGRHGHEERNARGGSFRAISSARLCASLHLHLRPINVVVCDGPRGDLILRTASCLDAFSAYPFPTWLPSGAPGGTTGGPEVGPARSSRTSASTAQISNAHDR